MSIISFDKVLMIIAIILNILFYVIGFLTNGEGKVEPKEEEE